MKRVLSIVVLAMLLLALVAAPAQAYAKTSIVVGQVSCGGGSTPYAMIRYRMNYTVHGVNVGYFGSQVSSSGPWTQGSANNQNLNWASGTIYSFRPGYKYLSHVGATFTSNTAPAGWTVASLVGIYCVS